MTETLKYKFMQLKGMDTNPVHFTVYCLSTMTTCENIHIGLSTDLPSAALTSAKLLHSMVTGRLSGRGTEGAGRLRTQRVGGTEGVGGTVVHSPLSSAVVEGPGTWLAAMSLTTTRQQQTD